MKIIKKIDVHLTEENVHEIIADYINKELPNTKVTSHDVSLSMGTRTVGYLMDEHDETYVREAVIRCKISEE